MIELCRRQSEAIEQKHRLRLELAELRDYYKELKENFKAEIEEEKRSVTRLENKIKRVNLEEATQSRQKKRADPEIEDLRSKLKELEREEDRTNQECAAAVEKLERELKEKESELEKILRRQGAGLHSYWV